VNSAGKYDFYNYTVDIDEVEVFTGSVKCFSRKMHNTPELTGQILSKFILGPYSRAYFSILQNLSKIFVVVKHWLLYRNTREHVL
jgi:hypothetical protein